MKIVADENIPLLKELFSQQFELNVLPTDALTHENIRGADILLCRSVTRVNAALLEGSQIKIVGSATSGIDHIDEHYLSKCGITLLSAPGANAPGVVDYVTSILALMETVYHKPIKKAAIIGIGQVGPRLSERFKHLGIECLLNDPYRANETDFQSTALDALSEVDLVSLHTPLTFDGPYPTHHLIDEEVIKRLKPGCVLINSARGGVLDEAALLTHGKHLNLCLDVFESEPNINPDILQCCQVATPHIAGHAQESKQRASRVLYQAICHRLDMPAIAHEKSCTPRLQIATPASNKERFYRHCMESYNPLTETQALKALQTACARDRITGFKTLRRQHHRYEIDGA